MTFSDGSDPAAAAAAAKAADVAIVFGHYTSGEIEDSERLSVLKARFPY